MVGIKLCIKVEQNFNQNLELIQISKQIQFADSALKNVRSFLIVSFVDFDAQ